MNFKFKEKVSLLTYTRGLWSILFEIGPCLTYPKA